MTRTEAVDWKSEKPSSPVARRIPSGKPVKVWAVVGVCSLMVQFIAWGGWIISGDAVRTPTGPTPVPKFMSIAIHAWEIAGIFGAAIFLWYVMIRSWRREGRITLDGLLCLVLVGTTYWQDTLINYFVPWFTYNSEFINFGAWNPHIIGWVSPNARYTAEPIIFSLPAYLYFNVGFMIIGCKIMQRAKARWPQLTPLKLIGICAACMFLFDVMIEPLWLRLGFYSYAGAISWMTIFHGHYYQFPLAEGVMISAVLTGFACIRYFKNDKGETMGERGLDQLRISGAKRTWVRFLALTGIVNVAFAVLYCVPAAWLGMYASPWPQDIQKRSYLTNKLCGPGTAYACPGPGLPVNRPNSVHLSPDGKTIVPEGTKLPNEMRSLPPAIQN